MFNLLSCCVTYPNKNANSSSIYILRYIMWTREFTICLPFTLAVIDISDIHDDFIGLIKLPCHVFLWTHVPIANDYRVTATYTSTYTSCTYYKQKYIPHLHLNILRLQRVFCRYIYFITNRNQLYIFILLFYRCVIIWYDKITLLNIALEYY